jgi:hypothetical protein
MEKVIEGFIKDGEIFLLEDINVKSARVKIIVQEGKWENFENSDDFLLKNRLKIRTKDFKFRREELYDRKGLC